MMMIKPMAATNTITFALSPNGTATDVSWTMTGARPYVAKVMGTLFNMDKMVGGTFAKGLADLKQIAESAA